MRPRSPEPRRRSTPDPSPPAPRASTCPALPRHPSPSSAHLPALTFHASDLCPALRLPYLSPPSVLATHRRRARPPPVAAVPLRRPLPWCSATSNAVAAAAAAARCSHAPPSLSDIHCLYRLFIAALPRRNSFADRPSSARLSSPPVGAAPRAPVYHRSSLSITAVSHRQCSRRPCRCCPRFSLSPRP